MPPDEEDSPSAPDVIDIRRRELGRWPPPLVVFNKSHSGSRLLASLLKAGGIQMGADVNESMDSLPILKLVEYCVEAYYPNFERLWRTEQSGLPTSERADLYRLIFDVFAAHLGPDARTPDPAWGWKLCETTYILPLIHWLFPRARYIHLVRDGRDVAFSDHQGPIDPFWRKVYFATDRIRVWRNHRLSRGAYLANSHVFNAQHWAESVTVGRAFGSMLHERYMEVRYEDLCENFAATADRILSFAEAPDPEAAIAQYEGKTRTSSIGKYRSAPKDKLAVNGEQARVRPTPARKRRPRPDNGSSRRRLR